MTFLLAGAERQVLQSLAARVPRLSTGSIFYHFVEGRRRPPLKADDFSVWLADWGPEFEAAREAIVAIDYHLWSLTEMRALIGWALHRLPRDSGGRTHAAHGRPPGADGRDDVAAAAPDDPGREVRR